MALFSATLVAGLATDAGPATAFAGERPLATCSRWKVIPSPTLSNATLADISGVSAGDVWAVGGYFQTNPPFIEHWDGTAWTLVDQPAGGGILTSVTAISADDVWAVGNGPHLLAEHWDGSSWSLISIPSPGKEFYLYGVDAVSSIDAWAVGYYVGFNGSGHALAEHWDGTAWVVVPTEGLGTALFGVSARSSTDVWAVGYQNVTFGVYRPLIEHWDGNTWSVSPSPPPPSGTDDSLYGVAAAAADDVWGVGLYGAPEHAQPLVEHWDGTAWSLVHVPVPPAGGHELFGVAAASPTDVWAVGQSFAQFEFHSLTEHWDGTAWARVRAQTPGHTAVLGGVTTIGSGDVWSVGYYTDLTPAIPLVEHSKGCRGAR